MNVKVVVRSACGAVVSEAQNIRRLSKTMPDPTIVQAILDWFGVGWDLDDDF
jgi:hypothetical protein